MELTWQIGTAARTVWQEARGEPPDGQKAVAHAIVNRLKDGRWGKTLYEVCTSEFHGIFQFTGWSRNDPNRAEAARLIDTDPALLSFASLIQAALDGEVDPTGGATHYYNPDDVPQPDWAVGATACGKFGHQLFFKGVK